MTFNCSDRHRELMSPRVFREENSSSLWVDLGLSYQSDPSSLTLRGNRILEDGSMGSITRTDQLSLRSIESVFARSSDSVRAFLEERPQLIGLLFQVWDKLQLYFPYSSYKLRVSEDDEGTLTLMIGIVVASEPLDEAMSQLKSFDQDWWLDAMESACGELAVDLAFE